MKRARSIRDFFDQSEKSEYRGLRKVISGGQVGADQAGLRAAVKVGLETGGTAPYGFMTSTGPDLSLKSKYGLVATRMMCTMSASYAARSMKNVTAADATLIFSTHRSAGTDKTIGYCRTGEWSVPKRRTGRGACYRPYFVINTLDRKMDTRTTEAVVKFLVDNRVEVLNVAGHRSDPRRPKFGERTQELLEMIFARFSGPPGLDVDGEQDSNDNP